MDITVDLTVELVCVLGCSTGVRTKKVEVDFSTVLIEGKVLLGFRKIIAMTVYFNALHFIS